MPFGQLLAEPLLQMLCIGAAKPLNGFIGLDGFDVAVRVHWPYV